MAEVPEVRIDAFLKGISMIAFISCVKTKQNFPCKAREMYISPLFKKTLAFAEKHADRVFILSAKYGLLQLEDKIAPYEKTLKNATEHEKKRWAYLVYKKFLEIGGNLNEPCLFLCGIDYRKYLVPKFPNARIPLKGLSFGNQLRWLKEHS